MLIILKILHKSNDPLSFAALILNKSIMKKLFFIAAFAVIGLSNVNAQGVQFGATAGLVIVDPNAEIDGMDVDINSETGFYVGLVADLSISDKFGVQPEVVYSRVNDGNGILVPIMAKYNATEKLNIQFGPAFDFTLEDLPSDFQGVGLSLGAGLGFDITENIFVEGRYNFQLNDYYTGDFDIQSKSNILTFGIGYYFN